MSKTECAKAPNMNDYYRVSFVISPANVDACDLLAAFLAMPGMRVSSKTRPTRGRL